MMLGRKTMLSLIALLGSFPMGYGKWDGYMWAAVLGVILWGHAVGNVIDSANDKKLAKPDA